MKKVTRLMTNICSDNLEASKDFYTKLFDFKINFESDWFIHLTSDDHRLELGIIDRKNDLVPKEFQENPKGFYLTFVVDNADQLFEVAKTEALDIISEPVDTFYGQRRMLLKDPDGALIDVSSPIENFEFPNN